MKKEIVHSVFFWLDPALPAEEVENFRGFFEALKKVPGVKTLTYGRAAATPLRPVVDNSFSYAMVATFDSLEDHNNYQDHELHKQAVEDYSRYWKKVLVRDLDVI